MDTKTMNTTEDLKAVYLEAGIDLSKDIIVSCGGGIAATVAFAGLKEIAEGKVAVYDGSWAEFFKNQ